jgi:hypothetical protein
VSCLTLDTSVKMELCLFLDKRNKEAGIINPSTRYTGLPA